MGSSRSTASSFPTRIPVIRVQALRDLNPSVVMEDGKFKIDPELDPFSPANGFNPNGASHYSKEFQARYFAAQSKA